MKVYWLVEISGANDKSLICELSDMVTIYIPREHTLRESEIAALTEERDAAIKEVGKLSRECGRVEAERDKLREALEKENK